MDLIRLDRFEELATGYDDMLKACRKAYPSPLAHK
jgi:hypothetical protein